MISFKSSSSFLLIMVVSCMLFAAAPAWVSAGGGGGTASGLINTTMDVKAMIAGAEWPLVSGQDDTIHLTAAPLVDTNLKQSANQTIRIKLQISNGCGWWKALNQFTSNNVFVSEEISVDDGTTSRTKDFSVIYFQNTDLNHWGLAKAKSLGVHTDYYRIVNMADLQPGYVYTIDWQRC